MGRYDGAVRYIRQSIGGLLRHRLLWPLRYARVVVHSMSSLEIWCSIDEPAANSMTFVEEPLKLPNRYASYTSLYLHITNLTT